MLNSFLSCSDQLTLLENKIEALHFLREILGREFFSPRLRGAKWVLFLLLPAVHSLAFRLISLISRRENMIDLWVCSNENKMDVDMRDRDSFSCVFLAHFFLFIGGTCQKQFNLQNIKYVTDTKLANHFL